MLKTNGSASGLLTHTHSNLLHGALDSLWIEFGAALIRAGCLFIQRLCECGSAGGVGGGLKLVLCELRVKMSEK